MSFREGGRGGHFALQRDSCVCTPHPTLAHTRAVDAGIVRGGTQLKAPFPVGTT